MLSPLLYLFAGFALQAKPPAEPARPALPKPLAELVERARHVPPEFGADGLLRIAESDAVADKSLRRDLIEEAFRMAGAAQEPIKRRGAREDGLDDLTSFQIRAFAQDLDALSLQSRAARDMLAVDKPKARDLFSQIPPPQVPRLTCNDALGYDVSAYFDALGEIARTAFTPKELANEEHIAFLAEFAGRVSSPAEIGPMAKVLAGAQVSPDQLEMLLTTFSAALKNLSADDRSFSVTVARHGATLSDLESLVKTAGAKQVSTIVLADAIRGYLVRHLSARRCLDTGGPTITTSLGNKDDPRPAQPDAVTFFNDRLRAAVYPPEAKPEPLSSDETRGNGLDIPEPPEPVKEDAGWKQLTGQYKALLFDDKGAAWSSEQKGQSEWQAKLQEFLSALADWKSDGDSSEHFYRKYYLLSSLSNVVPNGPMRQMVLDGCLQFLQQNTGERMRRIEWFLPVNTLLARAMFDPALAALAENLRNSPSAVIALYAQLDKLLPRSPGKLMELM